MIAVAAGRVPDVGSRHWVTQCALSRICGSCAESLGRPIAFLGTSQEVARNAFHLPPMHVACAELLRGDPAADPAWQVVRTAAFEFVRPVRDDPDPRPRFEPSCLL